MEQWISEAVSQILGEELANDLTQYILSVENESDFEDYMKNLFDFSVKEQKTLYENIKAAKFGPKKNKNKSKFKSSSSSGSASDSSPKPIYEQEQSESGTSDLSKKKTKKFRKFQLNELQKGYLKEGRNPCDCQATKHKLINNCLECGRIVCEQEGSGPCFFCDSMVCTKEELEILNSDTKESDTLYRTLNDRKTSETWKEAVQNRDRLLHYDQSVIQQTRIIDDEHDYYDVNNLWLSKEDRKTASKKYEQEQEEKHASRLGARRIVLDLLGKKAVEDTSFAFSNKIEEVEEDDGDSSQDDEQKFIYKPYVPNIETLLESLKQDKANFKDTSFEMRPEPMLFSPKQGNVNRLTENHTIQDKTYIEMSDRGMCLSMHQPWASLLVLGIKQHEGRTWYTPHRGLLWIASTSQSADSETIQQVEDFYRAYYDGATIRFPEKYPTGSLLGYVLVQDCLMQDDYRKRFPTGESESPHVLICSNPEKLIVPLPIKGEHKIYKLNPEKHTMARDALIVKKRFAV